MPVKKTTAGKPTKIKKSMTRPQAPKTKAPEPAGKHSAQAATNNGAKQMAAFEAAMKLFHARKLKEARDLFQQATIGPERDVAQRANLHIAMCDRRLQQVTAVPLGSAEDYYNYG